MKKDAWKTLVKSLDAQTERYVRFLALLREKETALIKGDTKALLEIVRREEKAVSDLEDAEQSRIEATAPLTADNPGVGLREMVETSPENVRPELEKSALALMKTLNEIALLNRSNAELVGESMNFVQYHINLLSSAGRRSENIYEGTGRMRSAGEIPTSAILNKRV